MKTSWESMERDGLRAHVRELTEQRDAARRVAVYLEQENDLLRIQLLNLADSLDTVADIMEGQTHG